MGLSDYGVSGQIGLEQSPDEYVAKLVDVFREVRAVTGDATLWLNLGMSYAGGGGVLPDCSKYKSKQVGQIRFNRSAD